MKAMLWKELRSLVLLGGLMLVALSATMAGVFVSEFDGYRDEDILLREALLTIALGSGAAALVLGLFQTVLEVRRDQWAFLLHRGLSATQIFLAKVGAGLAVYAAVTLVPVFIAVLFCTWRGVEHYPFSWYQVLPMLLAIVASSGLYFGAILAVVWKGPWYFSRVLPLAAPGLVIFAAIGFVVEVAEFVPASLFLLTVLAVGIVGVAAWGTFIRSGEAPGRPWGATVCLGIPIFVAVFATCLCLFAFAGAIYEVVQRPYWANRTITSRTLNRAGHVCEIVQGPVADRRYWNRPIERITDLDEPDSDRYASLKGKSFTNKPGDLPGWDPLKMEVVSRRTWFPIVGLFRGDGPSRVLYDEGTTGDGPERIIWTYSSVDGWLYGYYEEYEIRDGRSQRKPPRLAYVVGPDGFTDPSHRPAKRFGTFLASPDSLWNWRGANGWIAWPEFRIGFGTGDPLKLYLLFDDGLYSIDTETRTSRQMLVPRDGQKIRSLVRMEDAIAVVYDGAISMHGIESVPFGRQRDGENRDQPATLSIPGELQYSFALPREVASFNYFQFARLPDRDHLVFHTAGGLHELAVDRFVETKLDGIVVRSRDFLNHPAVPPEALPPLCGAALFVPAAPLVVAIVIDAVSANADGTGPGSLVRLWQRAPEGMLLVMTVFLGMTAFCGWSARRTARKYGFDVRARRAWQWIAILFGPAGLLTLWLLRDWPAMEVCSACRRRRPVNRDNCPQCGARFAAPQKNGTEILMTAREPADSNVLAG
jgi:hypothetical protein